ncbi:hypothetical protein AB0C13_22585 [Streptomyces sp. NPDC049099]|uniref:hypothetical protein n=1 Tax=Streptomyces sp. NPDC049099 TaxID=3155768 RepID=UPI0034433283
MSDRTRDPGDERPTGRFTQPPDEDWTPEDDTAARRRTPREPLAEERLPGEPPASTAPGTEGLTADDRTPEDTFGHPPSPAGMPGSGAGSEGLRPGTEDLAYDTGDAGPGTRDGMPDDGLGIPSSGEVGTREARSTESPASDTWPAAPGGAPESAGAVGTAAPAPSGAGAPLLPHEETDRWEQRMRQLAVGFVDEPRAAVEQADQALEEIVARFGEAVARRRRTLRRSWEASEDRGPGTDTDTEQLRLALRDYRELAGRLLHL